MKMMILVEFANQLTPEEALAALAPQLASVVWQSEGRGTLELRAMTANVSVESETLPNFPASRPVDSAEYDPAGLGRANTEGWPKHPYRS